MDGRVSGLSYRNLRESVGCLVVWLLDQSLKSPTAILVRSYIGDIKTDSILFAIRQPPFNLHSSLWIAYSELSSPFWLAGSVVCGTRMCGSQGGACLFGCSISRLSRPRRSLVRSYIEETKTDTILYAIRPPPCTLHSYPVDNIQ